MSKFNSLFVLDNINSKYVDTMQLETTVSLEIHTSTEAWYQFRSEFANIMAGNLEHVGPRYQSSSGIIFGVCPWFPQGGMLPGGNTMI